MTWYPPPDICRQFRWTRCCGEGFACMWTTHCFDIFICQTFTPLPPLKYYVVNSVLNGWLRVAPLIRKSGEKNIRCIRSICFHSCLSSNPSAAIQPFSHTAGHESTFAHPASATSLHHRIRSSNHRTSGPADQPIGASQKKNEKLKRTKYGLKRRRQLWSKPTCPPASGNYAKRRGNPKQHKCIARIRTDMQSRRTQHCPAARASVFKNRNHKPEATIAKYSKMKRIRPRCVRFWRVLKIYLGAFVTILCGTWFRMPKRLCWAISWIYTRRLVPTFYRFFVRVSGTARHFNLAAESWKCIFCLNHSKLGLQFLLLRFPCPDLQVLIALLLSVTTLVEKKNPSMSIRLWSWPACRAYHWDETILQKKMIRARTCRCGWRVCTWKSGSVEHRHQCGWNAECLLYVNIDNYARNVDGGAWWHR